MSIIERYIYIYTLKYQNDDRTLHRSKVIAVERLSLHSWISLDIKVKVGESYLHFLYSLRRWNILVIESEKKSRSKSIQSFKWILDYKYSHSL